MIAKSGVPEDHGDVVRGGDAGVVRGMENLDKEKNQPAQKRRAKGMPLAVDYAACLLMVNIQVTTPPLSLF